jgi:hypothetical protein
MAGAVLVYLLWRGRIRHAYYWLAAVGFALLVAPLLGALLRVPRPLPGLDLMLPWSFPSGPALLAASVYGFLAVSLARGLPERSRWLPYAAASALIGTVGWSRVYFGAEWLTDVVGSVALGLAWISALGLAFRRHSRFDRQTAALATVATLGLVASLSLVGWLNGADDLARYNPPQRPETLARADWLAAGWERLPSRRADLSQRDRHPLTIQYAGDLGDLARALGESGWQRPKPLEWGNALKLLSPSLPLEELPLVPQVHDGRHEALALVKTDGQGRRLALRLWPTRFRLAEGQPLWVGNVAALHKARILDLIAFPATDPEDTGLPPEVRADLEGLAGRLPPGAQVLILPRSGPRPGPEPGPRG